MKKYFWSILSIGIATAAVYYRSFLSPFFQDDKILLGFYKAGNIFRIIPGYSPYRPISQGLFYNLSYQWFGLNVFGYHLVTFLAFFLTLCVIFGIAVKVLKSPGKSLLVVIFYAFNISIFANFYWVATSYFSVGALFFFLAIWLYLHSGRVNFVLLVVVFVLALGSNEIAFVLPGVFLAFSWYFKYWPKKILFFLISIPFLLYFRSLLGLPKASDYSIIINFQAIATFKWYVIRALNLPEGINRGSDALLIFAFCGILLIFILSIIKLVKNKQINWKLFVLGGTTFVLSALPFYFLPKHMSSYYLTMALFGPGLIVGEVVTGKRLRFLFVLLYVFLTVRGLDFLSKTHWIILKNTGPIGQF